MQKSGFPKMRHYVGFSQIGSHICMHIAIHCLKVERKQAYEPPLHVEQTALVHKHKEEQQNT